MYRHKKLYDIKYTDVDAYDRLKLSSLLSFLEESACLSADELGFGYSVVGPAHIGFILANWYIKLFRPVMLGDRLEVHTWPLKPKHLIFLRDFELYCGEEKVGVAVSRWCMVNLDKFEMLPINCFFREGFFDGYNTERCTEFNCWKIPDAEGGNLVYEKKVGYSDCDHYFHVNNTKYADFLCDAFSVEDYKNSFPSTVQISYVNQCKQGETLKIFSKEENGGYILEGKVGDETRVKCRIEFNEI